MKDMSLLELPKIMEKSNANLKWFFSNQEWLMNKYPNELVAIDDEQFIDHDKSFEKLSQRLKDNNQYTDSILIQPIHDKSMKLM